MTNENGWMLAENRFNQGTWSQHPAFDGCRTGWYWEHDYDNLVWVLLHEVGPKYLVVVDDARDYASPRWRISSTHSSLEEALQVGLVTLKLFE